MTPSVSSLDAGGAAQAPVAQVTIQQPAPVVGATR